MYCHPADCRTLKSTKCWIWLLPFQHRQKRINHFSAHPGQFLDHSMPAERHIGIGVAAFMYHHQATVTQALGGFANRSGHCTKRLTVQQHTGERIDTAGIEAARNNDQIWTKALQSRDNDRVHGITISIIAETWIQRQIEVETKPSSWPVSSLPP